MELNQPYSQRREKPWGYENIWTPPNLERVGKVLFVKAGCKLSLQYHTEKEETISLHEGEALLWLQDKESREIQKIPMQKGLGYTIYPGQIHRLEALRDSTFLEVSTREEGETVRIEDDYRRSDEALG